MADHATAPSSAPPTLSMQDAILRLQNYWAGHGCVIAQPFNTEVGAGTMNPATILSVLGPEPWKVAYVEPSVRPDDSRYGENPNRLQTHTQFQVIVKPEPGNPQELYLGSLAALGIDLDAHDVRFVEDNWAQPAIGAWGLGWEVWLDGMEITQFTYFQQVGGQNLDPIPVEITYGLERILMAVQKVTHFKDLLYAPGVTYGEFLGQSEYEMSRYYLDDADVDATRTLLDLYSREADRMIGLRLPVPAHTFVLKSSHAFNVLDARGAISTTERAKWFQTMRTQSRSVAELWTELRAEADHPRGVYEPLPLAVAAVDPATLPVRGGLALLEIGTEELPPHIVDAAVDAVTAELTRLLGETALPHGPIRVAATPRRIAVHVTDVADREPDRPQVRRGPKVAAAYAADGTPSKALAGFLRGQQATADELTRVTVNGAEHVAVERIQPGRSAAELLTAVFSQLVSGLRSDKNMRWNDPALTFSRPIRWLVALLDDTVLPVTAGALAADRITRGHRQSERAEIVIERAADYDAALRGERILLDRTERRAAVVRAATELAEKHSGTVDVDAEAELVEEITNLVETPVGILGRFDGTYLDLPEQILTTVMRKHQRYLPVRAGDGRLLPLFVTMANGACDAEVVREGNESVLRARFEDATFFWNTDLQTPPAEFRNRLGELTFEQRLGSVAQRADRIAAVADRLARRIVLSGNDADTLARAGELVKFDLATQMVVEMTSLAGTMAREYARRAGESEAVAEALFEAERPRHHGDGLPATTPGALLALADRFDLLVAMLAIGAKLTGTSDPYGLRRAALGIVRILRDHPELEPISYRDGLTAAAEVLRAQGITLPDTVLDTADDLLVTRYEQRLRDEEVPIPLIEATRPSAGNPRRADDLRAEIDNTRAAHGQRFADLVEALQRIVRILPPETAATLDATLLTEPAERRVLETLTTLESARGQTLPDWTRSAEPLTEALQTFFDDILVMAEDPALRAARLGLLATVLDRAPSGIDWKAVHSLRSEAVEVAS
ncbi:glycine--tRNA ligase [Nocardia terpenica]|uniref:Multifunctional fusion protein n=1 Tax=Nocardia terpenica TaxID=455432 RepID=A0A291RPD4_9NOCA|nr:glycine--tRNA ligase [Nocardia terpenica]ATL69002.1 glycine--tRNA ligase subunit alpha/beta [Nocardia terpenica]